MKFCKASATVMAVWPSSHWATQHQLPGRCSNAWARRTSTTHFSVACSLLIELLLLVIILATDIFRAVARVDAASIQIGVFASQISAEPMGAIRLPAFFVSHSFSFPCNSIIPYYINSKLLFSNFTHLRPKLEDVRQDEGDAEVGHGIRPIGSAAEPPSYRDECPDGGYRVPEDALDEVAVHLTHRCGPPRSSSSYDASPVWHARSCRSCGRFPYRAYRAPSPASSPSPATSCDGYHHRRGIRHSSSPAAGCGTPLPSRYPRSSSMSSAFTPPRTRRTSRHRRCTRRYPWSGRRWSGGCIACRGTGAPQSTCGCEPTRSA